MGKPILLERQLCPLSKFFPRASVGKKVSVMLEATGAFFISLTRNLRSPHIARNNITTHTTQGLHLKALMGEEHVGFKLSAEILSSTSDFLSVSFLSKSLQSDYLLNRFPTVTQAGLPDGSAGNRPGSF